MWYNFDMNKFILYGFNFCLVPLNMFLVLMVLTNIFPIWVNNNLGIAFILAIIIWSIILLVFYFSSKNFETNKKIKRLAIISVVLPCIYGGIWFCGYVYILF